MKRVTKITEYLPCKLTEQELLSKGQDIAKAARDRAKLEDEKAEVAKRFKERIDGHTADIRDLAQAINTGEEKRDVECERVFDYANNSVTTIRLDTYQQIGERTMTVEERQLEMEIVKADKVKAKLHKIDGGKPTDEPTA